MSTYFIENYLDEYDVMSIEQHKYVRSSHSGKGRSKKEAKTNTNRTDPGGHTRKTIQKLVNNHHNAAQQSKNRPRSQSSSSSSSVSSTPSSDAAES